MGSTSASVQRTSLKLVHLFFHAIVLREAATEVKPSVIAYLRRVPGLELLLAITL